MALAAMESAAFSVISSYPSTSPKLRKSIKPFSSSSSLKFHLYRFPLLSTIKKPALFHLQASVESATVEEIQEKPTKSDNRRKLFVLNLPWSFSVVDIKNLFGECGIVEDVEIIKQKDGKNRGFAFVTMATGEEAQAAIARFDSFEVVGRIISVQFAKRFKRPPPPAPARTSSPGETRHKLYVSNLGWKVRSTNLREFFSSSSNPVSVKVVFDSPSGRSAGYGFVSFATKEEAESAISEFDGKELLGRPIRLTMSDRKNEASSETQKEEELSEQQTEDS
ncbi:hypothetical protein ACJIZ3_003830 [Penstemon smallii]|uniref:RRM domain-containing protein n=1 Tax=Penstemon smallii TaxID=265156 RepID=A0ABD3S0D9_9LAMI